MNRLENQISLAALTQWLGLLDEAELQAVDVAGMQQFDPAGVGDGPERISTCAFQGPAVCSDVRHIEAKRQPEPE